MVCVTWDDELTRIKIAILSFAFNREQVEGFQRLLKLASSFQSQWNWEVYLKFIYFTWWFYTNSTKQTLRQTRSRHMSAHVMARFAPFIFTVFYCNVWHTARFDNLTDKGLTQHWCKSNFRKPAEQNLFSFSSSNSWLPMRNIEIPWLSMSHSNRVWDIAVCCCSCRVFSCRINLSAWFFELITRKVFFYCPSNLFWPQGELFT